MYSRTNALKSTVLEQLPDDFYKVSMPNVAHNLTFCIKTFESSFNLQVEDLYRNSHPFWKYTFVYSTITSYSMKITFIEFIGSS